jgi:hypothetical protein
MYAHRGFQKWKLVGFIFYLVLEIFFFTWRNRPGLRDYKFKIYMLMQIKTLRARSLSVILVFV